MVAGSPKKFDLYVSQLVEQEISSGDAEAVSKRQKTLMDCSFLDITPEAVELASKLIEQNAIPKQAAEDALHIAIATVSGMDYLLTWNFKHIAMPPCAPMWSWFAGLMVMNRP